MKTKSFLLTALVTGTILFLSCNKVDLNEEERQIRELWTKTSDYGTYGDWDNYSKCFDHSSKLQMIHPGIGDWLNGWSEFAPKYEGMMKSGMKYSLPKNDLKLNISKNGDMAWGIADVIIQYNDSTKTQAHMWDAVAFEKINGDWKIVLGMASLVENIKQ